MISHKPFCFLGVKNRFLVLCVCFLAVFFAFRGQFLNGFSVLSGDRYDSVISVAILEHWFQVFSLKASWQEVGYFFPYSKTIANTDAYFLLGLIYSPFRFFGFDPFLSQELTSIATRVIGFYGIYLLSVKYLFKDIKLSVALSVLFVVGSAFVSHQNRVQLASVCFVPWAVLILANYFNSVMSGGWRESFFGFFLFCLLMGAWSISCFYMAWFFLYWLSWCLVVCVFVCPKSQIFDFCKRIYSFGFFYWALCVLVLALSLYPLFDAFYYKSLEVGVREYSQVSSNLVPLSGVAQTGFDNYVSGFVYNWFLGLLRIDVNSSGEYYDTGISFFLVFFYVVGGFFSFYSRRGKWEWAVFRAFYLGTFFVWLTAIEFSGWSAWVWVYEYFPGARALNVVSAIQIFLYLPVATFCLLAVEALVPFRNSSVILIFLFLSGELCAQNLQLERRRELDALEGVSLPPVACRSFYVSGWAEQKGLDNWVDQYYMHNVAAIYIAQRIGLPTVNGVASFTPKDWDFGFPWGEDYPARVRRYAGSYRLAGLCGLDLNTKKWIVEGGLESPRWLHFLQVEPVELVLAKGLSHDESWGVWSVGPKVELRFDSDLPGKYSLDIDAHAFLGAENKDIVVRSGGSERLIRFTRRQSTVNVPLVGGKGVRVITFDIPNPVSPKVLGFSTDSRELGVGFSSITISGAK